MKYILIAFLYYHGVATAEFNSKESCEAAGGAFVSTSPSSGYVCSPK